MIEFVEKNSFHPLTVEELNILAKEGLRFVSRCYVETCRGTSFSEGYYSHIFEKQGKALECLSH